MRLNCWVSCLFRMGVWMPVLFAAAGMIIPLEAQAPGQNESPYKMRVETRVVEIDVSVRDAEGRPVEDLKQADFTVTDNGKPRLFTMFSFNPGIPNHPPADSPGPQSGSPPTLAIRPALPPNVFTNAGAAPRPPEGHSTIILLDAIDGWFDNFAFARQSVLGLLARTPADEKIAIYVLVNGIGMVTLEDYTTDRSKLAAALAKVIPRGMPPAPPHMPEGAEGMTESPASPFRPAEGPASTEPWHTSAGEKELALRVASGDVRASLNTLAEKLKGSSGRKSVFWVTQGFPPSQLRNESESNWNKTFKDLNDANIEVNAVDANGLGGPPRFWGPGAILTLQQVAEKTGGQAYFHRNDIDAAMASGIANSRSSYTLAFYLTQMDGKYHELKVRVKRPDLQLSYRRGYYSQGETVPDTSAKKTLLEAELLNPSGSANVKITAALDIAPGKPRSTLNARLTLDPEPLSIKKTGSGYTGKIEEMFMELNADGREVGRFSDTQQFTLTASDKARFDTRGVTLRKSVPLVAGAVKLLIAVRDTASGRVGSLMIPLAQVSPQRTAN